MPHRLARRRAGSPRQHRAHKHSCRTASLAVGLAAPDNTGHTSTHAAPPRSPSGWQPQTTPGTQALMPHRLACRPAGADHGIRWWRYCARSRTIGGNPMRSTSSPAATRLGCRAGRGSCATPTERRCWGQDARATRPRTGGLSNCVGRSWGTGRATSAIPHQWPTTVAMASVGLMAPESGGGQNISGPPLSQWRRWASWHQSRAAGRTSVAHHCRNGVGGPHGTRVGRRAEHQWPTDAAPFSPTSSPSSKRLRANASISLGVRPVAAASAICSPETGAALNP